MQHVEKFDAQDNRETRAGYSITGLQLLSNDATNNLFGISLSESEGSKQRYLLEDKPPCGAKDSVLLQAMAEICNATRTAEIWKEALANIQRRKTERVYHREFVINGKFFPNDKQARLLDVLGCPPKEFIYGFDDIDGISRKIKEYKEKIKQFKKINKKKLVAPALTVLTAHRLSGKLYNNRLPHKKEIQKIFDKKTNGINPYVFSALHYGFGVPFDVCKEFRGDMAQELLNTMNDLHPKRGIKQWKPIRLEGIALQVDTTFAEDTFEYNPFKDAEDLLDICIKKNML
ncbi:hypothetical protein SELMODRAFT_412541 [Selaginella moellendorffii]|uniref:Uncharacterized protein n=1 Tax=Selaginella moellendorffii TaxID=88036 RepID=D8RLT5_SELML|nr:hypothetical protein SELMODRAFT_412541 [Selaginella moellendorffii]